ncbi:Hypothetical Protein FCC1311_050302 [Hondaea fermentalgiana]|uniref:Uncharacterized protein n=1 Tax=Hondaea fermentalgiana TaxID=2315210 RepID=A0A2R5GES6_9STRA|nr:Hypothetical Protein FCC1311_050302 [Hondaea fermentalgiana]|eukprot:GBG28809.1 Hypothetical Protein FCC1311_050302 [Hondaea fermentalgiana]
MDTSLDGGINSHAAGGPPEHGTSASHHFAHTNPYSNPYAPDVHHAHALQNSMMANATPTSSYASAITHHARQGAATMLSSAPTLMGSHASSGGAPEPHWPSSELNRRGSSASSAAEDSDDQQTSAGGAVGASARGQLMTSSAGGTAGFKYRKGKWNIEEEILLLHVVYCFIDRELKDIAVIAYHCGISRSSRAIDKKLKRVVYFEKWKKRDIPDMHAKLAAVLEKRGWTNLNASGQAVIANARRQAALRREASFAPVYASAEEQQHGPTLVVVDHHDGSLT